MIRNKTNITDRPEHLKCPKCGSDCILPAETVLKNIYSAYLECGSCPSEPLFNKSAPFHANINISDGRCIKCNKRHLDFVMGNVLSILRQKKLLSHNAALKDVGTPLIVFGHPIPSPPRLGEKSLILIMDSITKDAADEIIAHVPEIKGVIKRSGPQSQSVGILDIDSIPHVYELLSGCDMRCDVVSSSFGALCIYKNQALVHIEFHNTKISKIEELYLKGAFNNACVFDGFCGPGTLGLFSALAGAKKVIFNDAWLPAINNTILNLYVNSNTLGIKLDYQIENRQIRPFIGHDPVLMAKANGKVEIEVYHGDIKKTLPALKKCDVCLIDAFPAVDPRQYAALCKNFAKKVAII